MVISKPKRKSQAFGVCHSIKVSVSFRVEVSRTGWSFERTAGSDLTGQIHWPRSGYYSATLDQMAPRTYLELVLMKIMRRLQDVLGGQWRRPKRNISSPATTRPAMPVARPSEVAQSSGAMTAAPTVLALLCMKLWQEATRPRFCG